VTAPDYAERWANLKRLALAGRLQATQVNMFMLLGFVVVVVVTLLGGVLGAAFGWVGGLGGASLGS
jgi:hypothetical protein